MTSRAAVKRWFPPALIDVWRRRNGTWSGLDVSSSLSPASIHEAGYADPLILNRVETATRDALRGRTRYERDGLAFDDADVYWPVLGPLMAVRRGSPGVLRVLDIGGSLGSKWLQHRDWMELLSPLQWAVVEQPHYVDRAAQLNYPETLSFHASISQAHDSMSGVDVALFSSSLQYFESPSETLREAIDTAEQAVVLDRVTVWNEERDTLGWQAVALYDRPARYPCWLMSWPGIVREVGQRFHSVGTWRENLSYSIYPPQTDAFFGGVFGFGRRV